MRRHASALVAIVVVLGVSLAGARPKSKPVTPPPASQATKDEVAKLQKEYYELAAKQASFAAVKVARKLYAAQAVGRRR
jgi:hypothetical protein